MRACQVNDPLLEKRPLLLTSETQTPSVAVATLSRGRTVNACGAGGGTGPPSRCCALSYMGRLSCVKDDTLRHRPRKTGEEQTTRPLHDATNLRTCVICGPRCVFDLQSWQSVFPRTHAKADLLVGEGRQPARKKNNIKFSVWVEYCLYSQCGL